MKGNLPVQALRGKPFDAGRACLVAACCVVTLFGYMQGSSRADMLSINSEFDATLSESKTKDFSTGSTTNSTSNTFLHRYNLATDLNPYPLLRISGGSLFSQQFTTEKDQNSTSHGKDTIISPFVDVKLGNTTYTLGVGYIRTEETISSAAAPTTTTNEQYTSFLSWKPVDLPDLLLRYAHTNQSDSLGSINLTTDQVNIGTDYVYKSLNVSYNFTGTDSRDKISNFENTLISHNGIVRYADSFFNQRVSAYANYNFNNRESTTTAGAGGTVDSQLSQVISGLSAFNSDPTVGTPDQNVANPNLIDGRTDATTAPSTGINLGVVADGSPTANFKWSMGVGFVDSTQINTILIWVDQQLPPAIWTAFSWQIYTRNTDTDNWTLIGAPNKVTFGPFQDSFRLEFNAVTTRFIKVVVSPLAKTVALANPLFPNPGRILVTEFQGFISKPASQVQGTSSTTSQSLSCDVTTRILDYPLVTHNFNMFLTVTSPGSDYTYNIANTLNLDHKINSILSVGASVGINNIHTTGTDTLAYTYSASLRALPLKGLSDILIYSGRIEQTNKGTAENNSVFLTNAAEIYKGVALNLSTGYSSNTSDTQTTVDTVQFIGGVSIIPRQDLNLNFSYNRTMSQQSGGGEASSSSYTQAGSAGVSYRPFPSLYLLLSYGLSTQPGQKTIYTQNYGLNWSPFPDGDLQFSFNYNENIATLNNEKDTTLTPSINWKITRNASLNVSYSILSADSLLQSSETNVFAAILRISF